MPKVTVELFKLTEEDVSVINSFIKEENRINKKISKRPVKDAKEIAKEVRLYLKNKGIKARVYVRRYKRSCDLVSVDIDCFHYSYEERGEIKSKLKLKEKFSCPGVSVSNG